MGVIDVIEVLFLKYNLVNVDIYINSWGFFDGFGYVGLGFVI